MLNFSKQEAGGKRGTGTFEIKYQAIEFSVKLTNYNTVVVGTLIQFGAANVGGKTQQVPIVARICVSNATTVAEAVFVSTHDLTVTVPERK